MWVLCSGAADPHPAWGLLVPSPPYFGELFVPLIALRRIWKRVYHITVKVIASKARGAKVVIIPKGGENLAG